MTACMLAMILPPLSPDSASVNLFAISDLEGLKMIALITIILMVGFGASIAYLIPWSLLPDAIDADPEKPAGIYTAWMVLIQKLGIGISVQLLGFLLSLTGYRSASNCNELLDCLEQPNTAQITIRICMGLIPALLVGFGMIIMRSWPERSNKLKVSTS